MRQFAHRFLFAFTLAQFWLWFLDAIVDAKLYIVYPRFGFLKQCPALGVDYFWLFLSGPPEESAPLELLEDSLFGVPAGEEAAGSGSLINYGFVEV